MRKKKGTIKCDVEECKYNDIKEERCSLDEIKVTSSSDNNECVDTEDTSCDSFETEEDSKLTDEVYEVKSENEDDDEEKEEE